MSAKDRFVFREVGRLADFPRGIGKSVRIGRLDLAVFQTTDQEMYALENRTPHPKGGPLAEAIVSGHYIYCPLRDLKINLEDGQAQAPDTGRVRVFPVDIDGGNVRIGIPVE